MGRAPCCDKANVKRGPWSPDEDAILRNYIDNHGTGGNWVTFPQKSSYVWSILLGLRRCGKSCRLRWLNYLRPEIKHGCYTEEEDNIICSLYISIGSRWSVIASHLPGRTDNDVKNYWNTRLKRKLLAAGIIHPDSAKASKIPNASTRGRNQTNRSVSMPTLPHVSRSSQEPNIVSPSPSLPCLIEVSDLYTSNCFAGGNTDFHVTCSQEHSSSTGSSSISTRQPYFDLSIDDLLDLEFRTVYEILSNNIGFSDQESSSPYMIN